MQFQDCREVRGMSRENMTSYLLRNQFGRIAVLLVERGTVRREEIADAGFGFGLGVGAMVFAREPVVTLPVQNPAAGVLQHDNCGIGRDQFHLLGKFDPEICK